MRKKYHSECDISPTDVHDSKPSNKILVAYSMYPAFRFRPSIFYKSSEGKNSDS